MSNVRIGTVVSVSGNTARVNFKNMDNMQSRRLHIMSTPRTVTIGGTIYNVDLWKPSIGDMVLCLYPDGYDGTGYILGLK